MTLRPPSTPRASALPVPGGTPSSLPTARRKSGIAFAGRPPSAQALGATEMDSLRQAVRANDPLRYDSPAASNVAEASDSPSPSELGRSISTPAAPRRAPSARKPSLAGVRPTTPSMAPPRTPNAAAFGRSATPTGFRNSVSARPSSRLGQSLRGPAAAGVEVGDAVKFDVSGEHMEGTIRFLGEVEGKDGQWAGVELDSEWHGRGKNDGSVKGTQYFACEPLCGLFLPLSKITVKPTPPTPVASKITAGSRASKYLGMTAAELASKRRQSMGPPASPSKAASRQSISPEKPSSMTTPRATRSRPSMGGAGLAIPTPRKSLSASTPRPNLGASVKRPSSSLRNHGPPDVPPMPSAYSLGRSVTPSSQTGRATPATPSATGSRRMSAATDTSSHLSHSQSRPTTPSFRSQSRQSFASSVSRQSYRSTLEEDAIDDLKQQLAEGREREAEIRGLLQGSESLGREMEDKLADKDRKLKDAQERLAVLDREREREKEREAARLAGADDEEKGALRLVELETRVEELLLAEATAKAATDRLTREWETKCAAREGENESLRERMAAAAKAAEEERADLSQQLEQLRSAGQALCETYEERIADIELGRLESAELAETLQDELDRLKGTKTNGDRPASHASPSARLGQSVSRTSAADVIDAESAKAELDHLRTKYNALEEQFEDTREHLETEIEDAKRRRVKTNETEAMLKKEITLLKATIDEASKTEAKHVARIEELEDALLDAQTRLEEERSELEGLRSDANGSASASVAEELKRANRQLDTLRSDKQAALESVRQAQKSSSDHAQTIEQLRADLQAAEKELEELRTAQMERDQNMSVDFGRPSTPPPAPTQDMDSLRPSPSPRRSSSTSTGSKRSPSAKDEVTTAKDQIIGLKVIIKTLEEEKIEVLDRNKALTKEAAELRETKQSLEARVESLLSATSGPSSADDQRSSSLNDQSLRSEVEALQAKLQDVEKKSQREIKALNQEVSELESLVESKIYREDELEAQLERYKKLASKSAASAPESASARSSSKASASRADDDSGCEMCGEGGHDLDSCPIFSAPSKTAKSDSAPPRPDSASSQEFCDDCEEYGHSLENCPLANEIF